MVAQGATPGEGGGDVVVGVDRYDGNVKRWNHSCQHVASKQGHVRRRDAKPVPVGSHLARFPVQSQSQMRAWNQLLGTYCWHHWPCNIDLEI